MWEHVNFTLDDVSIHRVEDWIEKVYHCHMIEEARQDLGNFSEVNIVSMKPLKQILFLITQYCAYCLNSIFVFLN